jgi:hypothetical protein
MRTKLLVLVGVATLGVSGCGKAKSEQVAAPVARQPVEANTYQGGQLNSRVPPNVAKILSHGN